MKQKGKYIQSSGGSRSKSMAKAEDKARSNRHRRAKKAAIKEQS